MVQKIALLAAASDRLEGAEDSQRRPFVFRFSHVCSSLAGCALPHVHVKGASQCKAVSIACVNLGLERCTRCLADRFWVRKTNYSWLIAWAPNRRQATLSNDEPNYS